MTTHHSCPTDTSLAQAEALLGRWQARGYRDRKFERRCRVRCPRCDGCGEEPGAPWSEEGVWLCDLCDGDGRVPAPVAQAHAALEADDLEGLASAGMGR